jgi:hypothetical protein
MKAALTKEDFLENLRKHEAKEITYKEFIGYILDNWDDFAAVMPKGQVRAIRLLKPIMKQAAK